MRAKARGRCRSRYAASRPAHARYATGGCARGRDCYDR